MAAAEVSIFGSSGWIEDMATAIFGQLSIGLIQKGSFINGGRHCSSDFELSIDDRNTNSNWSLKGLGLIESMEMAIFRVDRSVKYRSGHSNRFVTFFPNAKKNLQFFHIHGLDIDKLQSTFILCRLAIRF